MEENTATKICSSGQEGEGGIILAVRLHEQPACARRVQVAPSPSWFPASSETPARAQPCIADELRRNANIFLSFWPALCTRISLLSAGWQEENAVVKYLQGMEKKAIQNDIQAPGLALSCQENRACKMLSVPPAQRREKPRGGTFPPAAIWVHGVAAVGPFPSVGFSSRHTTETVPGSFCLSPGAGLMRVCSRGADLCSRVKHGTSECHSTSASPRFSGCCTLLSGASRSKTGQEMLPETKGKALGSDCPSSACCLLPQTWGNFLIK